LLAHFRFPLLRLGVANGAKYSTSKLALQKIWAITPFWMMARVSRNFAATPPSADLAPAFAVGYDDRADLYNSGYDTDRHL
jgi:hypothetical protein